MRAERYFNVKNRSAGMVLYKIPELNVRREFSPGETKKISYEELEKLSFQSGGRSLLDDYLQITNIESLPELNLTAEPEYFMSEDQIIDLIKNGSLDAFLDCLDFAPVGVLDIIKQLSVSLPMNDIQKRQALKDKTGFDVTTAINNDMVDKAVDTSATGTKERRVKVEPAAAPQERRATTNYKVVKKD